MRKLILLTTIFAFVCEANAQFTGKPIYNIRVERSDTVMGNIEVELFPNIAPLHVANWDSIVTSGGYDSTAFHRIVPGFVIQGGDPNSVSGPVSTWGQGNASQANVNAEFTEVPHARGILSAARAADPNSASSQFFICVANAFSLDNNYSVYGQTISGMNIVDLIVSAQVVGGTERPADKISMFITAIGSNDSVPLAPQLQSPAANATDIVASNSFSWTSIGDAKLYMLEVATDTGFTNMAYNRHTKYTSVTIPGLDEYTTYYWRVRANNGGHFSVNPEHRMFTSGIGAPALYLPENLSTTTNRPLFDWEGKPSGVEYHLQVSIVSSFSNPLAVVYDTIVASVSEFKATKDLELNKKHFWRVVAIDSLGNESEFSDVWEFTPTVIDGISDLHKGGVVLYPNPATDRIFIASAESQYFTLLHVNGSVVHQVMLSRGVTTVDVSHLASGMYYYQIEQGHQRQTGKFIKQ